VIGKERVLLQETNACFSEATPVICRETVKGTLGQLKLPSGKALPKAGVFAHAEAKVVAQRIADGVEGKTPDAVFDGHGYCWIELGDGRAGFAGGNFYHEPEPSLRMLRPGRPLHWGKIAFEKWWLHHWL